MRSDDKLNKFVSNAGSTRCRDSVGLIRLIQGNKSDLSGNRTATGKASDKGAQATVNGYMAFLLFSVAGLACGFRLHPQSACG